MSMGENEAGRRESVPPGGAPQPERPDALATREEIPVLAAVIRRADRYLVGKRPAHKRHGGLWEFPGGKLRPGESWLEAARRELGEELAVDVLGVGRVLYRKRDPGSDFVIVFVEVTIAADPEPREHDSLLWSTPAELRTMELAPSDAAFVAACLDT